MRRLYPALHPVAKICFMLVAAFMLPEVIMPSFAGNGSRLFPCPDSPNCVSSQSTNARHAVAPLPLRRSPEESLECLKRLVGSMKRTVIVVAEEDFFRAESRTLLGFVDDLAFEIDRSQNVIHMRSASRIGYWDLGMNRRRLERLRAVYEKACL